jgi:UDP-N-acetylmuramoyl-tripeptide--D-alanyl-D-alanine ligase
MMTNMRLTDAAVRFGGTLVNPDCVFSMVSIDSRTTNEGDLFIAVSGQRFDAHSFIPSIANKIAGAVVSALDSSLEIPQWVVKDTTQALGDLARLKRDSFAGQVIAVTGSSGKTSVKEMIAAILRERVMVHATKGNLNNHIGVPLTLLEMDDQCDIAVIEMGASAAGEITYLCSLAQPDVALINNVQRAHIAGFGSIEAIAEAKSEIFGGLKPSGIAILNLDEIYAKQWLELIGERQHISFSVDNSSADVFAKDIKALGNGCYGFILCVGEIAGTAAAEQLVELPHSGIHTLSNALAAAACALAAGASVAQITKGLAKVKPVSGRLESKVTDDDVLVIDDTYNANPDSFKAAIDVLADKSGYRCLVMGDMGELGADERLLHQQVGEYAKRANLDEIYTLGTLSESAAIAFGGCHFKDKHLLIDTLQEKVAVIKSDKEEVTILVKGSRSARMDEIVERLVNGDKNSC